MSNRNKLFLKAEKLLQKQKFDAAFKIYLDLFQEEPNNEAVLLNLVDLSLRFGRSEDSLRYSNLLADLYIRRNDASKAIVTCRKILNAVPLDTRILAKLGLLLEQSRRTPEAAESFRQAAAAFRRNGEVTEALDCLQHLVNLRPENLEAQIELAEVAHATGKPDLAARSLLRAADIARRKGNEDQWAELSVRAHQIAPSNREGIVAAAEAYLFRNQPTESLALLEPGVQEKPGDGAALTLLCRAYLEAGEYNKAEPFCLELFHARPESVALTEQLIRGLLSQGKMSRAVGLLQVIKEQMYLRQRKKIEFLTLAEQIYHADETNPDILELLPPIYNELNRDGDLRLALARLFNLYLAGERYDKAAETLESILDVDPYGAAHADRLLNLEGHIDAIWYKNISGRISVPGAGHGVTLGLSSETDDEEPESGAPTSLEDLIVEAEMYHRYHLTVKLDETLKRIDRLHPGAHLENQPLKEMYEMAGFEPAPYEPPPADNPDGPEEDALQLPLEELGKLSSITAVIHRQATPDRVLQAAAEQLGQQVEASRCWVAAGPPDSTALIAEYVAPGLAPSDIDATLAVCSFLSHSSAMGPDGWSLGNVATATELESIAPQLRQMGIASLLAVPLMDKEKKAGLVLLEQCQTPRHWTDGEKMVARTVASQVAIAINSTRLRRLVRSLAGTDISSGLLPRSAYLDCLLAEARRAEEQSRPLTVCMLEPADAPGLSKQFGPAEMQACIQQASSTISSHIRQNDIAIRYGPHTIALCLPDTPLAHSHILVEKLQAMLRQNKTKAGLAPEMSAAVGDLMIGSGFDAVDAVTEIINRLEGSLETLRQQPDAGIILSRFHD